MHVALWLALAALARCGERDPYGVLGLAKGASMAAIRSAYRQKALATHPDKNAGREKQAEEDFREVVEAFELLSDDARRAAFDGAGGGGAGGAAWRPPPPGTPNWWHREDMMPPRMTAGWRRVVRVTSLAMLRNVALGDDGTVELPTIVGLFEPGACEEALRFNVHFPYPFHHVKAGAHYESWWAHAQYVAATLSSDVGRYLNASRCPSVAWLRAGDRLDDASAGGHDVLDGPTTTEEYQDFGFARLQVRATVANARDRAVRVFTGRSRHGLEERPASATGAPLAPGAVLGPFVVYAGERVVARDAAARDDVQSEAASLLWARARGARGGVEEFEVRADACADEYGQCESWARDGECAANPRVVLLACPRSCGACDARARGGVGALLELLGSERNESARLASALRDEAAASAELRGGCERVIAELKNESDALRAWAEETRASLVERIEAANARADEMALGRQAARDEADALRASVDELRAGWAEASRDAAEVRAGWTTLREEVMRERQSRAPRRATAAPGRGGGDL